VAVVFPHLFYKVSSLGNLLARNLVNMKRMMISIVMLATGVFGSDLSDWKSLDTLKSGDRVGVVQADLKRVEGTFSGSNDSGITVDGTSVPKDKVLRVYRQGGMSRAMRTLIGAAAGVAIGAVIAETAGKRFENEGNNFGGVAKGGWYAIGIGAGAGLGAASGNGYQTIYQRK
jgi:hypothetical protein